MSNWMLNRNILKNGENLEWIQAFVPKYKLLTHDCVCIHINTCIHACMPASFGLEKWLNCIFQIFKEIHNMKVYIHVMLLGGKPLVILPSKINAHEKVNHCKIYTQISVYISVFCTIFPWNWNGIAYKKKIYIKCIIYIYNKFLI